MERQRHEGFQKVLGGVVAPVELEEEEEVAVGGGGGLGIGCLRFWFFCSRLVVWGVGIGVWGLGFGFGVWGFCVV